MTLWREGLIVLAIFLLSGCGGPEEGRVVDRDFRRAYTDGWWSHDCYSYDNNGQCNLSVPVYHEDYHPDRWRLKLRNCGGPDGEGECKTGWVTVTQHTFDKTRDGSWYPPR